jgi:DNA polymerase III, alpha subunit (gram-positive type)
MIAVIVDTETTGLLRHSSTPLDQQPTIIELGVLRVTVKKTIRVDEHRWLFNPGAPLSAEITKITGLTDADLKPMKPFKASLKEVKAVFTGASVFIAHNAPFDSGMLRTDLARIACTDFPWPARLVCTVQNYQHLFGRYPKLTELYEHILGKPLAQKHRALDDCWALYEILVHEQFFATLHPTVAR